MGRVDLYEFLKYIAGKPLISGFARCLSKPKIAGLMHSE